MRDAMQGAAGAGLDRAPRPLRPMRELQPLRYFPSLPPGRFPAASARTGAPMIAAILAAFLLFLTPSRSAAQTIQYERPVQTAPQQDTIGGGYKTPPVQKPLPRDYWLQVLDVVLLAAAMGIRSEEHTSELPSRQYL